MNTFVKRFISCKRRFGNLKTKTSSFDVPNVWKTVACYENVWLLFDLRNLTVTETFDEDVSVTP